MKVEPGKMALSTMLLRIYQKNTYMYLSKYTEK